ncbi:MAG: hypothetical protein ACRBM6_37030 [Geminicoccales bacterium]
MSAHGFKRAPEIDMRRRLSVHLIDLLEEAIDVTVRMAILSDSNLIARKIADCERVLASMPASQICRLCSVSLDAQNT